MRTPIVFLFFILSFSASSQVNKKFLKMLDFEVTELKGTDDYKRCPNGDVIFYESWTFKGDTTGVSNDMEFLLFRDPIVYEKGELFKLFRKDWVSFYDWQNYVKWVNDSTLLERVYLNTNNDIPDEFIGDMLNHPEAYYDSVNLQWTEFDPSQPFINRGLFPLSWHMRGIKDWQIIPLISDLYLRPAERFYNQKIYDRSKFYYVMNEPPLETVETQSYPYYNRGIVAAYPDPDVFAAQSQYPFDLFYNLSKYNIDAPYNGDPVQGVLGTQIVGFLEYTEFQLQKKINDAGLPYRIRITLPTQEEIDEGCGCEIERLWYETSSQDMTEHWRITNESYQEFLGWVEDSIVMENVYLKLTDTADAEILGEMLNHVDVYYDEVNNTWKEFDPTQPFINRGMFFFNYKSKWEKLISPNLVQMATKELYGNEGFKKNLLVYSYFWEDLQRRSQLGELEWEIDEEWMGYESVDDWVGKDLSSSSGVRMHDDISKFIINEVVSVYPTIKCQKCNAICEHEHGEITGTEEDQKLCNKCPDSNKDKFESYDFDSDPDALIQGLSYAQAQAYYHWKYQKMNAPGKKDVWVFYDLVPSEADFERVQKGETMIFEPVKVTYPDPALRYVIHVYPK